MFFSTFYFLYMTKKVTLWLFCNKCIQYALDNKNNIYIYEKKEKSGPSLISSNEPLTSHTAGLGTGLGLDVLINLMQVYHRWLYLKFSPPSQQWKFSLCGRADTKLLRWASSRAFQRSSSEQTSNGSKFILREPENRTGSWTESHRYILLVKNQMFVTSSWVTFSCWVTSDVLWQGK